MEILRAKTNELRQIRDLTEKRRLNSRLNIEEATAQKTVLRSYPRRLVFELTNACNLNCVMCGRNAADFCLTRFEFEWVKRFDEVVDSVEEVTLMGWGEPTIHPDFTKFLYWAYDNGLRKYFCTNGMTLGRLMDDVFGSETDIIAVSLDGANAETNDAIRRGASYEKVVNNVSELVKRRHKWPYVNFVYTLMLRNVEQFPDFVRMAADLGVDEVKAVYLTAFDEEMARQVLVDDVEKVKRVFDKAVRVAEKYGISLKLPHLSGEDPAGGAMHKICYTGWRDFFLGSDGYVRACMSTPEQLFHIDEWKSGFVRVWNSDTLVGHRPRVNKKNMHSSCQNCYQSSFANWNKQDSFLRLANDFSPDWKK